MMAALAGTILDHVHGTVRRPMRLRRSVRLPLLPRHLQLLLRGVPLLRLWRRRHPIIQPVAAAAAVTVR